MRIMSMFKRPTLRPVRVAALLLASLFASALPASAQSIEDIVKKGKLVVGMLVDLPPYGMMNDKGEPDGYDADFAKLMAKSLGVQLEVVAVTGPNRIPYLLTNRVDVLVATFGITPERAKQVWFSMPYSYAEVVVIAPKTVQLSSLDQASNVRIGVPRASTQDTAITAKAPKDAKIMRFDDDATTAQALFSGQVDAIGVAGAIGAQLVKDNPALALEQKILLSRQFQGVTMRKGQADLLQWTNTFIYSVKNSGDLDALSQKWFGKPLPEMPVF